MPAIQSDAEVLEEKTISLLTSFDSFSITFLSCLFEINFKIKMQ